MREPRRLGFGGLVREEDGIGFDGLELVGGGTAALDLLAFTALLIGGSAFDDAPTALLLRASCLLIGGPCC